MVADSADFVKNIDKQQNKDLLVFDKIQDHR